MRIDRLLALLSLVFVSLPGAGRSQGPTFNLTISYSSTDPLVTHVVSADSTTFRVYLWCQCASTNVSMLEAVAVTDFEVESFTPADSVLNAGTAEHLKLAIDCVGGGTLLGEWVVTDTGTPGDGSFCLAEPGVAAPSCRVSDCVLLGSPGGYAAGVVGFSVGESSSCALDLGCSGGSAASRPPQREAGGGARR